MRVQGSHKCQACAMLSLRRVQLFVTPGTTMVCQAPLSMDFSRQEN